MRVFGFFLLLGFLTSCGSSNKVFVASEDKERLDVLMQLSRYYYDQGEYDKAHATILKAQKISPKKEDVSLMLAEISFAKAGFAFIDVLTKIIDLQEGLTKTETGTDTEDSGDASDMLGKFASLLNLTSTDLDKLSSGSSKSDNQFLKGFDVYYPKDPGNYETADAPRESVTTLKYINSSIATLCPFVTSSNVREKFDTNLRYQCDASTKTLHRQGQSNFLFALAHLLEAISFHSVILFNPSNFGMPNTITNATDAASGNLVARANKLNSIEITTDNIGDYVNAVNQLKVDIDNILSTTAGSMLNQTVLNFNVAAESFKSIPGMPKEASQNIESQLTKIEDAVAAAGKQKDNVEAQAGIFKEQLNKNLIPKLKESIEKFNDKVSENGTLTTEDQAKLDQVCSAYESIITGTTEIKPSICS